MFWAADQAFATGIVVKVIEFLLPEALLLDGLGMAAGLPESAVAIRSGGLAQDVQKALRSALDAVVAQSSAREFAEVGESLRQPIGIEVRVEDNQMHVCGHYNVAVDAKMLFAMAVRQAFRDYLAACL